MTTKNESKTARNVLTAGVAVAAVSLAYWALKTYLDRLSWNGGRCRDCGRLIVVHRTERSVQYVCPHCDKEVDNA